MPGCRSQPPGYRGEWFWGRPRLQWPASEETPDCTVGMETDALCRGTFAESRHRHDLTRQRDHKTGAGRGQNVAHVQRETRGRSQFGSVVREGVLRLRHADRCLTQTELGEQLECPLRRRGKSHARRAVDLARDRLDFFADGTTLVVERLEGSLAGLEQPQQ